MRRRAGAAVEDLVNSGGSSLANDLRSEIDFVVRGPDAGSDLYDEIGGLTAEFLPHRRNRFRYRTKFGSFLAGMHEANRARLRIGEKHRRAIRHIDGQADPALTSHQRIDADGGDSPGRIHAGDPVSMHLFGQRKWHA